MGGRPDVTLQIAPFSIGGIAAAGGPVTILRFLEPDLPDIVYLEQLTSALYLEKRDDVDNYLSVMDRLCAEAERPARRSTFLEQLLGRPEDQAADPFTPGIGPRALAHGPGPGGAVPDPRAAAR